MKQIIRLTESDLHRIVKESVNEILKGQRHGAFGSDDADLSDMWPDMYPDEEQDPLDKYNEDRLDNM